MRAGREESKGQAAVAWSMPLASNERSAFTSSLATLPRRTSVTRAMSASSPSKRRSPPSHETHSV